MDLHLTELQNQALVSLSSRTGRSAADLVVEAVDRLIAEEDWFDKQVQLGIDQIARGEFLEEDEMDVCVARMRQHECRG
jgi:predicted transcriptional regulator